MSAAADYCVEDGEDDAEKDEDVKEEEGEE